MSARIAGAGVRRMPLVIALGRSNRAVAGLSMGGMHTLAISTASPQACDYVGIFSHAARVDSTVDLKLTALEKGKPKLVDGRRRRRLPARQLAGAGAPLLFR